MSSSKSTSSINRPSLPPSLQTRPIINSDRLPGEKNGAPFSPEMRRLAMEIHNAQPHLPPNVREYIKMLQERKLLPSRHSILRWKTTEERLGHYRACRRSGKRALRGTGCRLGGMDLVLLALYRVVYPKATAAEINAFLYNANYGNVHFRFYTSSQITFTENLIGLSRKKGSTVSYQAFLPWNLRLCWIYWNLPFPLGIANFSKSFIMI